MERAVVIGPWDRNGRGGGGAGGDGPGGGGAAPGGPSNEGEGLGFEPLNDIGNAARFVARHGDVFRYDPKRGWLWFCGTHWTLDGAEARAMLAARDTVGMILSEAERMEREAQSLDGDARDRRLGRVKRLRAWAEKSGQSARLLGLLTVARAQLAATLEDFDPEPMALNVRNGTLRFAIEGGGFAVRLDPHDPRDMLSKCAATAYDPAADCPRWRAHLARVLPETPEHGDALRRFVARCLGYSITGLTREQRAFMHQGRGGDGKSTTMNTVRRLLGSYGGQASAETFVDGQTQGGGQATPDLAALAGDVRFVSVPEPKRGARLHETRLKQWTGGGTMMVRQLQRDPFEMAAKGRLHFEVNPLPAMSGEDDAMWRRIELIVWPVQIGEAEMDRDLERTLEGEWSGVLNWLIAGLADYMAQGLAPPDLAREAKAEYREGQSSVSAWIAAACARDPIAEEEAGALYRSYEAWCEDNGLQAWSQKKFGDTLSDMQIRRRRSGGKKTRRVGLRLLRPGDLATGADAPAPPRQTPDRIEVETAPVAGAPDEDAWGGDDDPYSF